MSTESKISDSRLPFISGKMRRRRGGGREHCKTRAVCLKKLSGQASHSLKSNQRAIINMHLLWQKILHCMLWQSLNEESVPLQAMFSALHISQPSKQPSQKAPPPIKQGLQLTSQRVTCFHLNLLTPQDQSKNMHRTCKLKLLAEFKEAKTNKPTTPPTPPQKTQCWSSDPAGKENSLSLSDAVREQERFSEQPSWSCCLAND